MPQPETAGYNKLYIPDSILEASRANVAAIDADCPNLGVYLAGGHDTLHAIGELGPTSLTRIHLPNGVDTPLPRLTTLPNDEKSATQVMVQERLIRESEAMRLHAGLTLSVYASRVLLFMNTLVDLEVGSSLNLSQLRRAPDGQATIQLPFLAKRRK